MRFGVFRRNIRLSKQKYIRIQAWRIEAQSKSQAPIESRRDEDEERRQTHSRMATVSARVSPRILSRVSVRGTSSSSFAGLRNCARFSESSDIIAPLDKCSVPRESSSRKTSSLPLPRVPFLLRLSSSSSRLSFFSFLFIIGRRSTSK